MLTVSAIVVAPPIVVWTTSMRTTRWPSPSTADPFTLLRGLYPSVLGLTLADVTDDYDYSITQAIAAEALGRGVEALLVPAASLVSANLVVFVDNLLPTSTTDPLDSVDPRLYVPHS